MSVIFRTVAKFVIAVLYITSICFFLRGHDAPGGGFIGGLLVIVASLLWVFSGYSYFSAALIKIFILAGLSSLLLSLTLSLMLSYPALTAVWIKLGNFSAGTPLLFDLGIYMLTIGSGLLLIKAILQDER